MGELFAPVCAIMSTKRRRFSWAAWWTAPPSRVPFRKPDASGGGAETWEEALAAAERAAGTTLTPIDASWARAWNRMLRGQPPFPGGASASSTVRPPRTEANAPSVWAVLGIDERATAEEIKAAFRRRALELHPDQGGDAAAFQRLLRAYEDAQRRVRRPRSKRGAKP